MADISQVLATGGTTIVGVAVGAGLTYWFGAMNRRHQEAREDETRWYDVRLKAYGEFSVATFNAITLSLRQEPSEEDRKLLLQQFIMLFGTLRLVGSGEALDASQAAFQITLPFLLEPDEDRDLNADDALAALDEFETVARKDLGHPEPAPLRK
jgi:hypothetical protein